MHNKEPTPMFTISSPGRIAAIAVALVGMTLTTMPTQAAPSLGGSLQLDLGVAPPAGDNQMLMKKYSDDDDGYWCADLTNKQIRKGLKKADFDDIEFVKKLKHNRVRVHALFEEDGWVYAMRIDRCDGEVDQIEALYEADDFDIDF
jgi:hypothetical protein